MTWADKYERRKKLKEQGYEEMELGESPKEELTPPPLTDQIQDGVLKSTDVEKKQIMVSVNLNKVVDFFKRKK